MFISNCWGHGLRHCLPLVFQTPSRASDKRYSCCFCCSQGPVALEAVLERSAYCAGENIKLRAEIQNGSEQDVWIVCKLVQVIMLTYVRRF